MTDYLYLRVEKSHWETIEATLKVDTRSNVFRKEQRQELIKACNNLKQVSSYEQLKNAYETLWMILDESQTGEAQRTALKEQYTNIVDPDFIPLFSLTVEDPTMSITPPQIQNVHKEHY